MSHLGIFLYNTYFWSLLGNFLPVLGDFLPVLGDFLSVLGYCCQYWAIFVSIGRFFVSIGRRLSVLGDFWPITSGHTGGRRADLRLKLKNKPWHPSRDAA
jgi:hypothetical protein